MNSFPDKLGAEAQMMFEALEKALLSEAEKHGFDVFGIALTFAVGRDNTLSTNCIYSEAITPFVAEKMADLLLMHRDDADYDVHLERVRKQ